MWVNQYPAIARSRISTEEERDVRCGRDLIELMLRYYSGAAQGEIKV